MFHWTLLIIAGFLEIAWSLSLRYAEGFTRLVPSLISIVTIAGSMWCLSVAMRHPSIGLGLGYLIFVGMGAVGAMILGVVLFNEAATPLRFFFLALLLASLVGLKATS